MKRGLLLGILVFVVLVLAVASPGTAHQTPVPYPPLEPSDGFLRATDVEPRTLDGMRDDTPGPTLEETHHGGYLPGTNDTDYYAVYLEQGDQLDAILYYDGSSHDLELRVYDPYRNQVTKVLPGSQQTYPNGMRQAWSTITARGTGEYYVVVSGDPSADVPYRLELDDRFEDNDDKKAKQPLDPGAYDGLAITSFESDWYSVDLQENQSVNVTFDSIPHDHVGTLPPETLDPVGDGGDDEDAEGHDEYSEAAFEMYVYSPTFDDPNQGPAYETHLAFVEKSGSVTLNASESGEYLILVTPSNYADDRGAYSGNDAWNAETARYSLQIETGEPPPTEICGEDAQLVVERYEKGTNELPAFADRIANGQRIQLVVNSYEDSEYTIVTSEDGSVKTFSDKPPENPSVRVETSCETVERVNESDDPSSALVQEYRNGNIQIQGKSHVDSFVIEGTEFAYYARKALEDLL